MDRIVDLRSGFSAGGHSVDALTFAAGMLAHAQGEAERERRSGRIVARASLRSLSVRLGDPRSPCADRDVRARIERGRWLADCECGGAEYVDLEMPILCCCSCWNRADGARWRRIVLPEDRDRIEALLLARPQVQNRNWRPDETAEDLEAENLAHGVSA